VPAPTTLLDGLPLPDRQSGAGAAAPARPAATARIEVRPGDSLWQLAAGLLPADADASAVASLCARLYHINRAVIGDDPDLIRPGQRLRVPHDSAIAQPEEEDR
jgi:nucleoid-associated protein YgaU